MKASTYFMLITAVLYISCHKQDTLQLTRSDEAKVYDPQIDPANFTNSTTVTNQYYPVSPGKKFIYEGESDEGLERVEEMRLATTKTILGIECVRVNFKAFIDEELVEETEDWYAQANDGSLWYFGEAVDNYENGVLVDHDGSWEAGVDGALPGIIMLADPHRGEKYREEFYEDNAEDEAQIIQTNREITIDLGTFSDCIVTRNWTKLEPGILEKKIYAPGVGLIREINLKERFHIDLVAIE
jgi:hypothetical protein